MFVVAENSGMDYRPQKLWRYQGCRILLGQRTTAPAFVVGPTRSTEARRRRPWPAAIKATMKLGRVPSRTHAARSMRKVSRE